MSETKGQHTEGPSKTGVDEAVAKLRRLKAERDALLEAAVELIRHSADMGKGKWYANRHFNPLCDAIAKCDKVAQ